MNYFGGVPCWDQREVRCPVFVVKVKPFIAGGSRRSRVEKGLSQLGKEEGVAVVASVGRHPTVVQH